MEESREESMKVFWGEFLQIIFHERNSGEVPYPKKSSGTIPDDET